jgi:hypothetical protein
MVRQLALVRGVAAAERSSGIAIPMGCPALELLDAVHAQPSLLSEAVLRQDYRKPMLPQKLAKVGGCSGRPNDSRRDMAVRQPISRVH